MGRYFPCLRAYSHAATLSVCDPCPRLDDDASVTTQPRTHPDAPGGHLFASAWVLLNVRTTRSDSQPTQRLRPPCRGLAGAPHAARGDLHWNHARKIDYLTFMISESVLLPYVAAPFTSNDIEERRVERQREGIMNPASPFGADRKAGTRKPQQIRKYHSERLTTVSTRFFGSSY